ncbi:MAG: sensor histidine kinase [Terriglobia bacterium]
MMLLFCVVVGILLTGSYLIFYTLLSREVHAQLDRQLVETSNPVVADLASDPTENDVDQLNLPGNYFELLSPSGRVLQQSINLKPGLLATGGALPDSRPVFRTLKDVHYGKLRLALVPFLRGGQIQILALAVPTRAADQALTVFGRIILWVLPLSLALTAFISSWYVGRSLRPVSLLTGHAAEVTARMAQSPGGDLWTPLSVANPRDELGRLAETFNHLFARVDEAIRQLRQFVTDASHELRTPLSVLQGETELVLSKPRQPEEYQKTLNTIDGELKHLSRIVEGLFTLSMADAGQLRLSRSPVYLNEVIEDACARATPRAQSKGMTIARDLHQEAAFQGDEAFLRELFLIFLDNSIKYSPPGARVSVTLEKLDGRLRVTFSDPGFGVSPDDLPHIFERFYRAARTADGESQSGGLGLAIAQAIAHAHGGSINCASEPGKGSAFTVTFPSA